MKIIQLNVRSYWGIRNLIFEYIEKENPDVVLLNSTGVINGKSINPLTTKTRFGDSL